MQEELSGEAVHIRVLPTEKVDQDEGKGGGLEEDNTSIDLMRKPIDLIIIIMISY